MLGVQKISITDHYYYHILENYSLMIFLCIFLSTLSLVTKISVVTKMKGHHYQDFVWWLHGLPTAVERTTVSTNGQRGGSCRHLLVFRCSRRNWMRRA
jgi:hypothetical protein